MREGDNGLKVVLLNNNIFACRDDLGSVVLANWSLWAPANFINFYLVSLQVIN